ncbi:MAG: hypothetical protein ABJC26_14210 [Gemmatimonadaceae bacterium]
MFGKISLHCVVAIALVVAAGACSTSVTDKSNAWGSDRATLSLNDGVTTLTILAGSCYGSYGELDQPISSGNFTISGRFTQLTGAYPGMVVYPATFSGTTTDRTLTITVSIPTTQTSVGPLTMSRGVAHNWERCLYP